MSKFGKAMGNFFEAVGEAAAEYSQKSEELRKQRRELMTAIEKYNRECRSYNAAPIILASTKPETVQVQRTTTVYSEPRRVESVVTRCSEERTFKSKVAAETYVKNIGYEKIGINEYMNRSGYTASIDWCSDGCKVTFIK